MARFAPIVQVAFASTPMAASPVWTDITQWVQLNERIQIRRGRQDELATIQAGQLTLTLDNADGRFTAGSATSPYYPNVKKNKRIRVRVISVDTNQVLNPSFETDTGNWSVTGTVLPTLTRSTTRAHHGTASGLIAWGTGGTGPGITTDLWGLDIGRAYTATAWVWVAAGSPAVRLGVTGISTGTASATTAAWEQISYTFTATSTSHTLTVTPATAPTSGHQVWVDEVMVGEGSSPVTFSATGATLTGRYNGFVNQWPIGFSARTSAVQITATDLFKRLSQTSLASLLEEEVLADGPAGYWPMSEPRESISCGDVAGGGAGSLGQAQVGTGGTLELAGATGPAQDGLSCPKFTPVDASNGLHFFADLGADIAAATAASFITIEAWVSTTDQGRAWLGVRSSDSSYRLAMSLESGTGRVKIDFVDPTSTASVVWTTSNLADDHVHHIVYEEGPSGGTVYVDGVSQGVSSAVLYVGNLARLEVGGRDAGSLWSGGISHVAIYAVGGIGATRIDAHYDAGATGFAGEGASTRIARLAGYAGITTVSVSGSSPGQVGSQGPGGKTALAALQEVELADGGTFFASRTDGLMYQTRDWRYNKAAAVSLSAEDLKAGLRYGDDDQFLVNSLRTSRPGGATIRLAKQDSIDEYGPYHRDMSLIKDNDSNLLDAAWWTLNRYANPAPRLESIPVEASTLGLTTYRALLDLQISDVIEVTSLPSQAPATTHTGSVEGYTEVIELGQHHLDIYSSPTTVDSVWVLDSSTHSQLDVSTRLAY